MEPDRRTSLERAIQTGVVAELKDLHTCLPGEVISFDAVEQVADIQLMIKRKMNGEWQNIPVLKGVPVRFQRSADFAITFPLKAEDQVMVIFCERSIDTWLEQGGIKEPSDFRRHDFSDAFALPMMYPKTNKIPDMDANNLQIKTITGNVKLSIRPDGTVDLTTTGTIDISTDVDVNINAGADVTVNAGADVTVNATGDVNVDADGNTNITTVGNSYIKSALTTIDNDLTVTGSITGRKGLHITGTHPAVGLSAYFGGVVTSGGVIVYGAGDVIAGTISLKNHLTTAVTPGIGFSGVPI